MKNLSYFIVGIIFGCWLSWPGLISSDNWNCFFQIINKSKKEKLSIKTVMAISPKYLLRGKRKDNASNLRFVSDVCFR